MTNFLCKMQQDYLICIFLANNCMNFGPKFSYRMLLPEWTNTRKIERNNFGGSLALNLKAIANIKNLYNFPISNCIPVLFKEQCLLHESTNFNLFFFSSLFKSTNKFGDWSNIYDIILLWMNQCILECIKNWAIYIF